MNNDHIAEKLKAKGESHYDTGGVQLIDLFRTIKAHESLSVAEVSALTSIMRYATRMLKEGTNKADVNDCEVYSGWLKYWLSGKEEDANSK